MPRPKPKKRKPPKRGPGALRPTVEERPKTIVSELALAAEALPDEPRSLAEEKAIKAAGNAQSRFEHIVWRMASGIWERGKTTHELAAIWRIAPSTIENYSAEASRYLVSIVNADDVRRIAAHYIEKRLREVDEVLPEDNSEVFEKAAATAKLIEPWGKVVGAIQSGTQILINIPALNTKASPDDMAKMLSVVFEVFDEFPDEKGSMLRQIVAARAAGEEFVLPEHVEVKRG